MDVFRQFLSRLSLLEEASFLFALSAFTCNGKEKNHD